MTSLATFGTFLLSAAGSIAALFWFYVGQRTRREAEIRDKAVADYVDRTALAELRRKVAELEQRDEDEA